MTSNIDSRKLLTEVNNIKIKIGVEDRIIKQHETKLKNLGIQDIADAQKILLDIESEIEKLNKRVEKLKNKAIKIIDGVQ